MNFFFFENSFSLLEGSANIPFLFLFHFFLFLYLLFCMDGKRFSGVIRHVIYLLYLFRLNCPTIKTNSFLQIQYIAFRITIRTDFIVVSKLFIYFCVCTLILCKLGLEGGSIKPKIKTHSPIWIWVFIAGKETETFHNRFPDFLETFLAVWLYCAILSISIVAVFEGITFFYTKLMKLSTNSIKFIFGESIGGWVEVELVLYLWHDQRQVVGFKLVV